MLNDIEHLPKDITKIDGIDDVLLAIDPEITLLRNDLNNLQKELYVKTTDALISRWEQDFGIPFNSSLTLQQRRDAIIDKMGRKATLTWANLNTLIRRYVINPQFYIVNNSGEYHFRVIIQDNEYSALQKALKTAKPAYITFDIVVTGYMRRCGTFNCGTEPV